MIAIGALAYYVHQFSVVEQIQRDALCRQLILHEQLTQLRIEAEITREAVAVERAIENGSCGE